MFASRMLALVAAFMLAEATRLPTRDLAIETKKFSWSQFPQQTGVDPSEYLSDKDLACTDAPSPDRAACPSAYQGWNKVKDSKGKVHIDAGQCISVSVDKCSTVACAPSKAVDVNLDVITGQFWNPLGIKCVLGGKAGIYRDDANGLVLEVALPK